MVSSDSALLLPLVYNPKDIPKVHEVCIVLHFSENEVTLPAVEGMKNISVTDSPEGFVNQILECEAVLSSSLHGLIIAHSYGIPAVALKLSENVEDFKFGDYYRSLGIYMKSYRKTESQVFRSNSVEEIKEFVAKSPQPKPEVIREMQTRLLQTFPLKRVVNPMESSLNFEMCKSATDF